MNRFLTLLLLVAVSAVCQVSVAQSRGAEYKKQAQNFLNNKEYVKARYYFLQAYNSFARDKDVPNAVECGAKVSSLYHRENYYKEAFDALRGAEALLTAAESETGTPQPGMHYTIGRERLQMYMKLKNAPKAKEQLSRLEQLAKSIGSDSIANDALYAQANYYYTFGIPQQGDSALDKLIGKYKAVKDYGKVSDCYKTLIDIAIKGNNAKLTSRTYGKLMAWNDSVRALTAADELAALQTKYDESLATIEAKDSTISGKQYIIVALCVLAAILAAALVLGAIVLMRYIVMNRRQKHTIEVANEHNRLKNKFIKNISAQLRPTVNTLDPSLPAVKALNRFLDNVQELSELESTLGEGYDTEECNAQTFCQEVMERIEGHTRPDVSLAVDAAKVNVKLSREPLEQVLLHLLSNAAIHTPEGGRILLEFKKRGAKVHQFIVTDNGPGVPEEISESLFRPFAEIRDLTQGDSLGLPICSLKVTKMHGTITLDPDYKRGARFIIEIRS